ncbi:hypothetical protein [Rhodopirellula sp. MGV]|uniref:hypothetical protein n=1 Tax=Rhodopirellula sp. MGV TaxID=2023130 RepID=UPI000B97B1B9|nr:hypothetical protein [Rhodopirellula sp. MGV]OYP36749.1 hypothetical protein CGZ80_07580 [Rhodopirellula sp. MGV]PNY34442.1 hypothetical protein C2E31_23650 [Rhodopirellula baltica]
MGETIHRLVLAAISLTFIASPEFCFGQQGSAAQGTALPGSGIQIPQSFADSSFPDSLNVGVGNAANALGQKAKNAIDTAVDKITPPDFTRGTLERASTLNHGPTTEPLTQNGRQWLPDASNVSRPSTEPFGSASDRSGASGFGGLGANPQASATSNPQNASGFPASTLPTETLPNTRTQNGFGQGAATTANTTATQQSLGGGSSFGKLPANVSLPPRAGNDPSTAAAGTATGSPGFDLYNTEPAASRRTTTQPSSNLSFPGTAASNPFGQSARGSTGLGMTGVGANGTGDYGSSVPSRSSQSTGAVALGLPTSEVFPKPNTYETRWTAAEIAVLGKQFNLSPNDARMKNPEFVNQLYEVFDEQRQKERLTEQQRLAGQALNGQSPTGQVYGNSTFGGQGYPGQNPAAPSGGLGRSGVSDWDLYSNPNGLGQTAGQATGGTAGARGQDYWPNQQGTPSQTASQRRATGKKLFDENGFPVDSEGNILDANGNPVDEATAAAMMAKKVMQQQMDEWRKTQEEREKRLAAQAAADPQARVASSRNPGASTSDLSQRQGLGGSQDRTGDQTESNSPSDQRPTDFAGLGSESIRKSNPYVNVLLLCSLVSNAFLLTWLHRLWQNHRDLIASSRMSANSISVND